MVVQHNLTAMNANRYLGINNSKLSKSLEKLSSGYAINRAGDNAAGLAVSEKMRSQIAGMTQAVKNAQDGISMVQTFEGALTETDSILQRMKTLADQMANGTYDDPVDRTAAQQEFLQLNDELDQIADTDFNGVTVLNGGVMSDGVCAEGITAEFDAAGHVTKKTVSDDFTGSGVIDYRAAKAAAAAAGSGNAAAATKALGTQVTTAAIGTVNNNALQNIDEDKYVAYAYNKDTGKWVSSESDEGDFQANTNGGFQGVYGDTINVDTSALDDGDYIVVKYTAGTATIEAALPETWDASVTANNATTTVNSATDAFEVTGTKGGAAVTGADLDTALDALDTLNGATITLTTDGTETGTFTMTAANTAGASGIDDTRLNNATQNLSDGQIGASIDAANGKIDFYYNGSGGNVKFSDLATNTDVIHLGSLKIGGITSTNAGDTVTYILNIGKGSKETPGADGQIDIEADATNLTDDMKATLTDKLNGKGGATDDSYAVSVSNSYKNSEAKMTYANNITLQVGARTKDAVNFTFTYASTSIGDLTPDLDCTAYGLGTSKLNLNDQKSANEAIDKIDQAINKVSLVRGTFGAIQNRLEHKIDNLNVSVENLTSAESQIRDTNMPQEMMNFTKQQILAQASQSMLAQANQLPQGVLSLLQ